MEQEKRNTATEEQAVPVQEQPTEQPMKQPTEQVQTPQEGEPLMDDAQETVPPVQETQVEEPQPTEQTEQSQPQAKKKRVKLTDFTARILAEEKYTVEEAISLARRKLQGYRYLDDGFVKATEAKDAFTATKSYAPVCRSRALVQYTWRTGAKQNAVDHDAQKEILATVSVLKTPLQVEEIGNVTGTPLDGAKMDADLYPGSKLTFADTAKALRSKAETLSPNKKAKLEWLEETYELVYVPVLTLVCVYGGVEYRAEVNLVNGACRILNYLVSQTAIAAADKTMERVARAKRSIVSCFFYALTFAVLAFLSWYQAFGQVEGTASADGAHAILSAFILSAIALIPLVMRLICNFYKKQKMIDRAVNTGKLPKCKGAVLCRLVAFLAAVASVVVFAVFVLL